MSKDVVLDAALGRLSKVIEGLANSQNDVDFRDEDGRTALMEACINGHIDIVEYLLRHGAKSDIQDIYDMTAVHFAVSFNQVDIVRILRNAGANLDIPDENGNYPLWTAVFRIGMNSDMVRILLEFGCDPDIENNYGVSARNLAENI